MRSRTPWIAGWAMTGLLLMAPAPGLKDPRDKLQQTTPGAKLERSGAPKAVPEASPKPAGESAEGARRVPALGGGARQAGPTPARRPGAVPGALLRLPPGVTAEVSGTVAMLSNGNRMSCTCDGVCDQCVVEKFSPGLSCSGSCGQRNGSNDPTLGPNACVITLLETCTWTDVPGLNRPAPRLELGR